MPPELAEVKEWLRKAEHDRRVAEAALDAKPAITDIAAFHCQQAAEKYIKAYLVHRREPFEKIHDLEVLVGQCVHLDPAWNELRDSVEPLTAYAVRFRYPGPPDPSVEEVLSALMVVGQLRDFVLERLPDQVRP